MAVSRERMGTETGRRAALRPPPPEEPPLAELEFTGCKAVPMSYDELLRYEGRLEVWDARSGIAWMVSEPTSPTHESPSHGLAGLVERIGAVRGSPIKCYGSMDLLVRNGRGRPRRIMQADQTVYLYPSRESRAFPGWRARAIHDALNEVEPSGWTHAKLERPGRAR